MTAFLPTGQGDITNPGSWRDAAGNIPPLNLGKVPANATYPYNGDGRYWWTGNLDNAPAGVNYFIGDEAYLDTIAGSISLEWQIAALSTDGSAIVLSYSTDGGTTWVATTLPLGTQGLQSGAIVVPMPGTVTGLAINVTYSGGVANPTATLSE